MVEYLTNKIGHKKGIEQLIGEGRKIALESAHALRAYACFTCGTAVWDLTS